jgi:hypothetical protein
VRRSGCRMMEHTQEGTRGRRESARRAGVDSCRRASRGWANERLSRAEEAAACTRRACHRPGRRDGRGEDGCLGGYAGCLRLERGVWCRDASGSATHEKHEGRCASLLSRRRHAAAARGGGASSHAGGASAPRARVGGAITPCLLPRWACIQGVTTLYACFRQGPAGVSVPSPSAEAGVVSSFEHSDLGVVGGALSTLDAHGRRAEGAAEPLCSRRHASASLAELCCSKPAFS